MKKSYFLAFTLILNCGWNTTAARAETFRCDPEELNALLVCAADAMDACYEAVPDCAEDDVAKSSASNVVQSQIYEQCCFKSSKGAKIACLKSASLILKLTKTILPANVRNDAAAQIKTMLDLVKSRGECDEDDSIDDPGAE